VRCLCFLGCFNNIKVVLVLSASTRVLRRVQDLLLSLQLLLKHDLSLLLVVARSSILQSLRVASCSAIALEILSRSSGAPVIL
jgi:hypothetical protein